MYIISTRELNYTKRLGRYSNHLSNNNNTFGNNNTSSPPYLRELAQSYQDNSMNLNKSLFNHRRSMLERALSERALKLLGSTNKELRKVSGATHLFREPGRIEEVAGLTLDWFVRHLTAART
jgi:hypothetical protein